jgi:hypothetical protein
MVNNHDRDGHLDVRLDLHLLATRPRLDRHAGRRGLLLQVHEERGQLRRRRQRHLVLLELLVEDLLLLEQLLPLLLALLELALLLRELLALDREALLLVGERGVEELPVQQPQHHEHAGEHANLVTGWLLVEVGD